MKSQSFKSLVAWKTAHSLAVTIYKETTSFPRSEQFGLTNQMRRAAVSVTSNIAEGYGRWTAADKRHFYVMATGSLNELESQLFIAKDIGIIEETTFESLCEKKDQASKLLIGLMKSVQNHPKY